MKTRLNLTVDEKIVRNAKRLAAQQSTSLSQLVEDYLKKISAADSSEPLHIRLLGKIKSNNDLPVNNAALWAKYGEHSGKKYGY